MQTTRTIALRLLAVVMLAAVAAAPLPLAAQRGDRGLSLGLGVGRIVPLQPLASTDVPVDYELDDAGAAILAVDYWFTGWVGMRLSYQWVRTNMAEPDGPSSARIWSGYGALLLSPFAITRGVRPYFALGPGMRRYDVNAVVFDGTGDSYDVAPRQNRLAGYSGAGVTLRRGRIQLVPEAGVFVNTFRHVASCRDCAHQKDLQLDLLLALQFQLF